MSPSCRHSHAGPASGPAFATCRPVPARQTSLQPLFIINLFGSTTTGTGLKAHFDRDTNEYPPGIRINKPEMAPIIVQRADFGGDWNCTLLPAPDNIAAVRDELLVVSPAADSSRARNQFVVESACELFCQRFDDSRPQTAPAF